MTIALRCSTPINYPGHNPSPNSLNAGMFKLELRARLCAKLHAYAKAHVSSSMHMVGSTPHTPPIIPIVPHRP